MCIFIEASACVFELFIIYQVTDRPLGRPRHRWEDNIKIDIEVIGWCGLDLSSSG
jgi:hypothetical protein